jgi:hypothetical protein
MTSHRTISLKTALLVVLLTLVVPYPALASPLLGGYGGPGEGNQAILGSALVGGAGGGTSGGSSGGSGGPGGSAGSSSSPSTGAAASAGGEAESTTGSSQQGSTTGAEAKGGAGGRAPGRTSSARERSGKASGGVARAYPRYRDDASQATSGGSQALGLSAADFAYVLLALVALAATAAVTRRLARTPAGQEGV